MDKLRLMLGGYRAEVEAAMRTTLSPHTLPLYDMMRYHLGWADERGQTTAAEGGKRLRPIFCLLACEAVGGTPNDALPAAVALELVHNFSLVHDDIQDISDQRHGRPTVWRQWGAAQAINVGDGLFVLARLALLRLQENGVPAERVLAAARLLDAACLRLCEGQYLDLSYQDRTDVGVDDYLRMAAGKTAALLGASLGLGAVVGTDDKGAIATLQRFGEELGLAFQIRDDVLGIWGERGVTGKPVADDVRERKKSLPVVYALEGAAGASRERLHRLYAQPQIGPDEVEAVVAILDGVGARAFAEERARQHYRAALAALSALPPTPGTDDAPALLRDLAAFVVDRAY